MTVSDESILTVYVYTDNLVALIRNSCILFSHKVYVLNKNLQNLDNYEEKTL